MSHSFAFEFIGGKYEEGIYFIPDDHELLIGRGADLDIVLVEDMVSRRHARLKTHDRRLVLEDLRSTNGTFVNGERIEQRELACNDRVLIGTSILKVARAEELAPLTETRPQLQLADLPPAPIEGSLAATSLDDVLALLARDRSSGLLDIKAPRETFELAVVDGLLTHAQSKHRPQLSAEAALVESLATRAGTYHFAKPVEGFDRPTSFQSDQDATLFAARSHQQKIDRLAQEWPGDAEIELVADGAPPWSQAALGPQLLDVLQQALTHRFVAAMRERAPLGSLVLLAGLADLAALRIVRKKTQNA